MIEEQAHVTRIDGDIAEILIEKQSACGSCSAKSGCGTSLLSNWFPRRLLTLRLKNTVDAKCGDTVVLGLNEAALQRGSLLLYALPLAGLLIGSIGGERAFGFLGLPAELGAVLFGLLGVTITLIFVRQHSRSANQGGDGGVRLLRVVRRSESFVLGNIAMPGTNQPEGFGTNK